MNNDEATKMIRDAGITFEEQHQYFEYKHGKIKDWEWEKEEIQLLINRINNWKRDG